MAGIIISVYNVVSAIATKVKEVRELLDECHTLCDIVTKLQPIISSLTVQLGTSTASSDHGDVVEIFE